MFYNFTRVIFKMVVWGLHFCEPVSYIFPAPNSPAKAAFVSYRFVHHASSFFLMLDIGLMQTEGNIYDC